MQARNKKDLARKIGLNLADFLRQKKRDDRNEMLLFAGLCARKVTSSGANHQREWKDAC